MVRFGWNWLFLVLIFVGRRGGPRHYHVENSGCPGSVV